MNEPCVPFASMSISEFSYFTLQSRMSNLQYTENSFSTINNSFTFSNYASKIFCRCRHKEKKNQFETNNLILEIYCYILCIIRGYLLQLREYVKKLPFLDSGGWDSTNSEHNLQKNVLKLIVLMNQPACLAMFAVAYILLLA